MTDDPCVDGLARLSALVEAVQAATSPEARAAALGVWLADAAATSGATIAAVDDPAAYEGRLAQLGAAKGGGAVVTAIRRALRPRIEVQQAARRESLRARAAALRASAPAGAHPEAWEALQLARDGRPRPTGANVHAALRLDPAWAGKVRWNEFRCSVEVDGELLADTTETEIANALAERYGLDVRTPAVDEQIRLIADRARFHPVRAYLDSLPEWDGRERLRPLLPGALGAQDTELNHRLGVCFAVSAVARIWEPGCKVDTCLILCGAQGALKSTSIRALLPDARWYADTPLEIGNKDRFEQIQGKWLYELAEIDKFRGADWARVKALFSSSTDLWRRPFGRNATEVPRQALFVGTTNADEFLDDPTGARRFWPVRVGETGALRPDLIAVERDQLWAEALMMYRKGEPWHLSGEHAAAAAAAARQFEVTDAWDALIAGWLGPARDGVTAADVLQGALEIRPAAWTKADQMRVAASLRRLGWERRRETARDGSGDRLVRWHRSAP